MSSELKIRRCNDCMMRSHGILKDLSNPIFERISCCMTTCKFPPKHLIFIEGNPCGQLASIRRGLVKISKYGDNGRTQIIGSVGPGFMLGYELFRGMPYQTTAETLTETELCVTTRDEIMKQIDSHPEMAMGLVGFLCHRISELEQKTLQLGAFSARQRLAAHLLAIYRAETQFGHGPHVEVPMSRQEIADLLGMAKETLIRLLAKFAEIGVVKLSGSAIRIEDPEKLEGILTAAA